jgi:ubiquinone/menaquinone biosynthesis C-methylase UbiE
MTDQGESMQMNHGQDEPENYQARVAYQNKGVATQYDQTRFKNLRGRVGDWFDKRAIKRALESCRDCRMVLDVPCGTGRITTFLIEQGYGVTAADVSVEMMAVARSRFTKCQNAPWGYVQVDAAQLPFRNASFDCATAIRFMGHVPAPTRIQVLRELGRVSRGPIIIDYCIYHPMTHIRRRIEDLIRTRRLGFAQSWTWQSIPKAQLMSEFEAAGLQAVRWVAKIRLLSDAWIVLLQKQSEMFG